MFGRLFSLVFGGAVGAYGMHQYIESQARNGKFPDWEKISTDAQFAISQTTTAINRAIADEDTQKTIQKAKEKGTEVLEQIKNQVQETSNNVQADPKYKRLKKDVEEKYE